MKSRILFASILLGVIAPLAQAGILSINDLTDSLTLRVDQAYQATSGGTPGGGSVIDIATPTPMLGISAITYNAALETLSFTFANQINWAADVYYYQYFTDSGGKSDLFVIQGLAGHAPDYITFISDPGTLSGDITAIVPRLPNSTATPINQGDVPESGDWQLAFNTGVDQYYVRSDVEVPDGGATGLLLVPGVFGLACFRRKLA